MKLQISGVSFEYNCRKALADVTLEVNENEIVGIIGPNGAGKTTLLKCINRILKPQGSIFLGDKDISQLDRRDIAKSLGMVPQNPSCNSCFPVLDIVLMGRNPHLNKRKSESSYDLDIAKEMIKLTGIEHLVERRIDELSGGERQRAIIARALAQEPRVLLLDEPVLHLDLNQQREILRLTRRQTRLNNLIVLLVIHDLNLAARYCDRLILLDSGRVHSVGEVQDIITSKNVRQVYGIDLDVISHPVDGLPLVVV